MKLRQRLRSLSVFQVTHSLTYTSEVLWILGKEIMLGIRHVELSMGPPKISPGSNDVEVIAREYDFRCEQLGFRALIPCQGASSAGNCLLSEREWTGRMETRARNLDSVHVSSVGWWSRVIK